MNLPNLIVADLFLKARLGTDLPAGFHRLARRDQIAVRIGRTRRLQEPAPAVSAALGDVSFLDPAHQFDVCEMKETIEGAALDQLRPLRRFIKHIANALSRNGSRTPSAQPGIFDLPLQRSAFQKIGQRQLFLALFLFEFLIAQQRVKKPGIAVLNVLEVAERVAKLSPSFQIPGIALDQPLRRPVSPVNFYGLHFFVNRLAGAAIIEGELFKFTIHRVPRGVQVFPVALVFTLLPVCYGICKRLCIKVQNLRENLPVLDRHILALNPVMLISEIHPHLIFLHFKSCIACALCGHTSHSFKRLSADQ